tara:strand:- start:39 stop:158 length:120 start_codon:yes stop_codon:yes gene_type:complete
MLMIVADDDDDDDDASFVFSNATLYESEKCRRIIHVIML